MIFIQDCKLVVGTRVVFLVHHKCAEGADKTKKRRLLQSFLLRNDTTVGFLHRLFNQTLLILA